MRHTISVLVENEFGVLTRVAGLFSGRGFNIESLCVAETLDPTISAMTIVTPFGNSFTAMVDNLQFGVNMIYVYGTNQYGTPNWDSIQIRRLTVNEMPYIDITNTGPLYVAN